MKRFAPIAMIIMMFAFAAGLSACATGRWESRELVNQRYVKTSLEQRVEEGKVIDQGFKHPAKLDPIEIEAFMGGLYYPEAARLYGAPREEPVFQFEEITRLAPALAGALAEANPNERVHFISINKGQGLIFKDRRQTEGVTFVDARGRLNMAFSAINEVVEPGERTSAGGDTGRNPLTIENSDTPVITKKPFIAHVQSESGTFPMWVTADPEALRAAAKEQTAPEVVPSPITGDGKNSGVSAPRETTSPSPAVPSNAAPEEQLRAKLQYLKKLHDEGLINKTEYEAKKRELLEQIK